MVNVDNRGTPRDPRGSNNSLYFIVGALVIAVLIIGWFMYGGDDVDDADVNVTTEEPMTPGTDTDVDVTVDPAEPPATEPVTPPATEPATPPATDTTEPATPPATDTTEPATPPAGGTTTEPATPPAGGTTTTP